MKIVKIRRVGNSNVITLPREFEELGFSAGDEVVLDRTADGGLHILPARPVQEDFQARARRVVAENREALDLLAAYDRGEQVRHDGSTVTSAKRKARS
ncbi:MAG TPA: AbrB/MazE/SpoVT family DNA-binding domain-containing protein [Dehalococcoidia bacterium]|nr:AbrB/MazE/SpoVT family DNA-binding domain-containing protein [Dehalococcoidia bacterium]